MLMRTVLEGIFWTLFLAWPGRFIGALFREELGTEMMAVTKLEKRDH